MRAKVVFKRAEKVWRTPNRCVELRGEVPERMLPGQSVKVHVRAVSKRGDPAAALANTIHRFYPQKSAGLGVDPFAYVAPDPDAGHDFTLTAPAKPWSDAKPERFVVTFYSKAGIGEIDQLIRADRYPSATGRWTPTARCTRTGRSPRARARAPTRSTGR